jgi:hypothetical protein
LLTEDQRVGDRRIIGLALGGAGVLLAARPGG